MKKSKLMKLNLVKYFWYWNRSAVTVGVFPEKNTTGTLLEPFWNKQWKSVLLRRQAGVLGFQTPRLQRAVPLPMLER